LTFSKNAGQPENWSIIWAAPRPCTSFRAGARLSRGPLRSRASHRSLWSRPSHPCRNPRFSRRSPRRSPDAPSGPAAPPNGAPGPTPRSLPRARPPLPRLSFPLLRGAPLVRRSVPPLLTPSACSAPVATGVPASPSPSFQQFPPLLPQQHPTAPTRQPTARPATAQAPGSCPRTTRPPPGPAPRRPPAPAATPETPPTLTAHGPAAPQKAHPSLPLALTLGASRRKKSTAPPLG